MAQGFNMGEMQKLFEQHVQNAGGDPAKMNPMMLMNSLTPEQKTQFMANMQQFQKQMASHGHGMPFGMPSGSGHSHSHGSGTCCQNKQTSSFQPTAPPNQVFQQPIPLPQSGNTASSVPGAPLFSFPPGTNEPNIHVALNTFPAEAVEDLVKTNPQLLKQRGFNGMTPLHTVVMRGQLQLLNFFLNLSVDVNAPNDFKETPLHFACKKGNIVILERLIQAGADAKAVDKAGRGAMHHAAITGNVLTMHYLHEICGLDHRVTDNNLITPMHLCCAHGHDEALLYLVRKNRCDVHVCDIHGNTPLHIAAQYGQTYICWKLMELGGYKMMKDLNKDGLTPVALAQQGSMERNGSVIELLLVYNNSKGDSNEKAVGPTYVWYGFLLLPLVGYLLCTGLASLFPTSSIPMATFTGLLGYYIYNQYHRMGHVSRWPNPLQAGMFAAGIFGTILNYFLYVLPNVYSETPKLGIATVFGCLAIIYMYYKLMTMDPGIARESARKESTGHTYTIRDISRGDIRLEAWCTICEVIPPRRSKHCRLCECCLMDCDHHCLFLYRCVARYNHRLFVYFITLCIIAMTCFGIIVLTRCMAQFPNMAPTAAILIFFNDQPGLIMLAFINIGTALWLTQLLKVQIGFVSKYHTTAYQPNNGYTDLTPYQRIRNVINFLLGKGPYAVDSQLKVA